MSTGAYKLKQLCDEMRGGPTLAIVLYALFIIYKINHLYICVSPWVLVCGPGDVIAYIHKYIYIYISMHVCVSPWVLMCGPGGVVSVTRVDQPRRHVITEHLAHVELRHCHYKDMHTQRRQGELETYHSVEERQGAHSYQKR